MVLLPLARKRPKAKKNDDETNPVKRCKEELEKLNQEAQNAALIARPRLQLKRKLRLASDCAGLGSDLMALRLFGCQHLVTSSAWSDNDSTKRKMYRAVCHALGCSIAPCCKDMTTRDATPVLQALTFMLPVGHVLHFLLWGKKV